MTAAPTPQPTKTEGTRATDNTQKGTAMDPNESPVAGRACEPVRVSVVLPVDPGRTFVDTFGRTFHAEVIEHQAYLFEGDYYRAATVRSATYDSREVLTEAPGWSRQDPDYGTWPQAPAWFDQVAAEIEASVSLPTAAQQDDSSTLTENGSLR